MPTSVTMPQLGESVTEGTVTRWLKQEGEQVEADEPLLEVSTDKVDTEIPAPASGVLTKIMVAEDETVQVGAELATIGDAADSTDSPDQPADDGGTTGETASGDGADAGPDAGDDAGDDSGDDAGDDAETEAEADPAPESPADQEPAAEPKGDSGSGTPVTMPALGESVTEGTVTRWLKSVGDSVAADDPLVEVSTDKVDTEIPAPTSGILLSITVAEDETVQVGAELAIIGSDASAAGAGASGQTADNESPEDQAPVQPQAQRSEQREAQPPVEPEAAEPAPAAREQVPAAPDAEPTNDVPPPDQPSAPAGAAGTTQGSGGGAYVTPLVRKLAAEHDVDLAAITGTGVGGRIRKQDVLEAASATSSTPEPKDSESARADGPAPTSTTGSAPSPARASEPDASKRGRTEKLTRLRALIGKRMIESLQVSAQLTTVVEVDLTQVARLRDRLKQDFLARENVKLSFLPFFALAAVEALKTYPTVNSSIDSEAGTVTYHDSENLGIAVDTDRGLLVPVIHNAGDLNLGGIARKIADLAARTRNNKVTPDELGGGTFTLTNTGSRGALFDTPIINQPQVAILGTGTVVKRPVVVEDPNLGEIVTVRSMVYLALTYDHRIVDGADAARFLVSMKDRLEAGEFESSLGLS